MSKKKPDLSLLRQKIGHPQQAAGAPPAHKQKGRIGMESMTLFFPSEVKRQLWNMRGESRKTIQRMVGEALNDYFAKNGKPEIVPLEDA
jgi:hypothetical protein